jgi:hypothetical protein
MKLSEIQGQYKGGWVLITFREAPYIRMLIEVE